MLSTNTHDLHSAHKDSSTSMIECESEEGGWVVIKKQRITILVPPPSPPQPQSRSPEANVARTMRRKRIERNSNTPKKKLHKISNTKTEKLFAAQAPLDGGTIVDGTGICSRAREPHHRPAVPCQELKQPVLSHAYSDGRSVPINLKTKTFVDGTMTLRIGALNVVNQRVRALNLERKLNQLGGLRKWLMLQGLHHFITVFEREKVGKYQLVNLTMSKLKDMGVDAVGPRRRLINAIDFLCQPYYLRTLQ